MNGKRKCNLQMVSMGKIFHKLHGEFH